MKMKEKFLVLTCFLSVLVCDCSGGFILTTKPTQPNVSALYHIPELQSQLPLLPAGSKQGVVEPLPSEARALFQQLYSLDSRVAIEVGKLPEFQGKVSDKQILALQKFMHLFANATTKEKANLEQFLNYGKPEIRKYCTPLQAMFWMFEKMVENPLFEQLAENPLRGSFELLFRIAWDPQERDRWGNFEEVVERLNSPELIDHYERTNFIYEYNRGSPGMVRQIFRTKRGDCRDFTAFSAHCLAKAGYKACAIKVVSLHPSTPYHVVCEFEDNGKLYIMDNSCRPCIPLADPYRGRVGIEMKETYVKRYRQIGYGYQ